jgi:hypothetical protein
MSTGSAGAAVCEPLRVETTIETRGPNFPAPEQAYGMRGAVMVTGDFNGDGYGDSAFSEIPLYRAGKVFVVFGSLNVVAQAVTQSSIPGEVESIDNYFGTSLAVGDFNADGYDDLVVTSMRSNGLHTPGKYFVIPGGASGLRPQQAMRVGTLTVDNSPQPMTVGDFDRDGFDDIATGQPMWQGTCPQYQPYGRLIVAFGTGSANVPFDRFVTTAQNLNGVQCGAGFGTAIGSGPVQGRMRVLVGQPSYDLPGSTPVKDVGSYLQFELTDGLQQVDFNYAVQEQAHYGSSFAFGDFDGDARKDYAIGAWGGFSVPGWVRIGFARGGSQVLTRSDFGGSYSPYGDGFATSIAAGDFDGDRTQDLIVAERQFQSGPPYDDEGAILIARGKYMSNLQPVHKEIQVVPTALNRGPNGVRAIDADNDGIDEVLVSHPSSEVDEDAVHYSGFVTRSKLVNLDQCSPD